MRKDSNKKGNPIWLNNNNLKKSHYDSDHNGNGDNMNSTSTSSTLPQFKKLLQDPK